jgi:uncharacterized protein YuzE
MGVKKTVTFQVSISAREDGTIEAVYIRLDDGKVAKTVEIDEDVVLADYNARGKLLGIELLAPVKLSTIASLVDKPRRASFRKVVARAAPEEFLVAS